MSTPANITIASVGSYCSINHITVNGSYIKKFNTTFDPTFTNLEDNSGWSFYGDLAVVAAIERVNSDPDILPGIHVNLKRFTDCGGYDPDAALLYEGKSGGYASAVTAMDVADIHADVIGVVGNEFSSAVIGIGEILSLYQLPFCGNCATSPRFSDKNKYPYYFRPLPPVTGDSYLLALKTWNVKRVAIVYEKDAAQIVHQSLVRGNIEVITSIALPSDFDKATYDVSSKALKTFHSRYVIVLGSNPFIGATVYRLSKSGLDPSDMVYLSENALQHYMDPLITLGPDYYNVIRGFIWVTNPFNPAHQVVKQMQVEVSKIAGADIPFEYVSRIYLTQAYDCVMMMLLGFHKLLQENPQYTAEMLQNRQLQHHMNWTLFKDLGTVSSGDYHGLTWDEMRLNPTGDLELPIILYRYTGHHLNVTSFALSNLDWTEFVEYNKTGPIFHNNSTVPPPDGPKPLTHYSNSVATLQGFLLAVLASIGTLATVSLAAVVVSFRNNKVVRRAAIPEILTFIAGCSIGYTSLWFYIGDPTVGGCKARVVLVAVSYVCMVASLTLRSLFMVAIFLSGKAYRNSKALKNVQARFWGYLALFVAVEVMLVTAWSLTSKMRTIEMETDEFTYTQCSEIGTTAGWTIMVLMHVLHVLVFVLLLYTLYQHKHIKSESAQDHLTTLVLTAQTFIICVVMVEGLAGTNSATNVETDPRVAICIGQKSDVHG
ncbi:hypothetical protein HDU80_005166 [Chytriomyces hyalinus]|nr:hypothetical protein HDU80_005166 [Chytriomyces hyalinus]